MDPKAVLQIVDSLHREKNIDKEVVFQAIEAALVSAAKKHYGEEADITFQIDREDGKVTGICNGESLDIEETIGRIGAQTAKQVIIQKVREAERDALIEEYQDQIGHMISGIVQRADGGATTVSLGGLEAILPRSEQIPGESHHANERVRAVICEVRAMGSRVKVVLSRTRKHLVQRLFEQEIPEIADGVIVINAMAREPGYRSKVAVSSHDQRVDCVGACVGVRGNRIKNIVDELAGERIDIVRWNDDPQVLIPNALQPAEVDEVILCKMMGRAIVLVREDQLSLAIGRRGQNVRLASKLCGWDIEIMTQEELEEQIDRAVQGFCALDGVDEELANRLVGEGYLSYDDLSVIEPDDLAEMGGLSAEQVELIIDQAEQRALVAEEAAAAERKRQRELERIQRATAEADAAEVELQQQREAAEAQAAAATGDAGPAAEVDAGAAPDTAEADAAVGDSETAGRSPDDTAQQAVEAAEESSTIQDTANGDESAETSDDSNNGASARDNESREAAENMETTAEVESKQ